MRLSLRLGPGSRGRPEAAQESESVAMLTIATCIIFLVLPLRISSFFSPKLLQSHRCSLFDKPQTEVTDHCNHANMNQQNRLQTSEIADLILPKTFQAVFARGTGRSFREVAEIRQFSMDEISPRAGEVVVKVLFAGINGGCETFRCRGEHIFERNRDLHGGFPLGAEGSGIVVEVGSGVECLNVGDHVSFLGGAFAEYLRLRADGLIKVSRATAATAALRISAVTACGVLHTAQAKAGDVVLVTAAAGGSGHFAVQLAKQAGCTVIGTCSSDDKAK